MLMGSPLLDVLWREKASPADMNSARHHRRELGDKVKPWETYEADALAALKEFWPMVEAVAKRLLSSQNGILSGHDIDAICIRVVQRQHLRNVA